MDSGGRWRRMVVSLRSQLKHAGGWEPAAGGTILLGIKEMFWKVVVTAVQRFRDAAQRLQVGSEQIGLA